MPLPFRACIAPGWLVLALAGDAAAEGAIPDGAVLERAGCRVRTAAIDARGVATVAADCHWAVSTEAVVATLRDPEKLGDALSSLRLFERLPDGRVLQVHEVGWPLDDRQVTLDWRETPLAGGGLRIEVAPSERQEPLGEGRAAIVESRSRWEIRPDGRGGTELSYRSRYDAGGTLKPWLVRRFQKLGVASSLAELRSAIARR
jgi:carbon monoxide dehydrogenase subunit G